jgi:hypothetical protein
MATWGQNGTGWDHAEAVQKVAQLVWNPDTLSWVRATQASGSGGSAPAAQTIQKFDAPDAATLYCGSAIPGSLDMDQAWRIKRVIFDAASGLPLSVLVANSGASVSRWDQRAALSYS